MDVSGSMQGAGGVGGLLSVHDQVDTYYPTYDGNGNVSEYLNTAGELQAHYEYDAFGNTTVSTGAKKADFFHRFSTKPQDAETGLYYYGYRYYDPVTGRWPSRDPIDETGGVNIYCFVGNRAISLIDIFGLVPVDSSGIKEAKDVKPQWRKSGRRPFNGQMSKAPGFHSYLGEAEFKCKDSKVTAKVSSQLEAILLNQDTTPANEAGQPTDWKGVYGHEQRHIRAKVKALKKIVEEIKAEPDPGTHEGAAKLSLKYNEKIRKALEEAGKHDESHGGDPNDPRPKPTGEYKPLPGSPPIPPKPNQ